MMDPDQFVVFIQMMDAVRLSNMAVAQAILIASKFPGDIEDNAALSDNHAEEARNNAQHLASKAHAIKAGKRAVDSAHR